jgi:hypothetical protein
MYKRINQQIQKSLFIAIQCLLGVKQMVFMNFHHSCFIYNLYDETTQIYFFRHRLCRYNKLRAGRPAFESWQEQKGFLYFTASRPVLGPTLPSVQRE